MKGCPDCTRKDAQLQILDGALLLSSQAFKALQPLIPKPQNVSGETKERWQGVIGKLLECAQYSDRNHIGNIAELNTITDDQLVTILNTALSAGPQRSLVARVVAKALDGVIAEHLLNASVHCECAPCQAVAKLMGEKTSMTEELHRLSPYWNSPAVQQLRREIRSEDAQKVLDNAEKATRERLRRAAQAKAAREQQDRCV